MSRQSTFPLQQRNLSLTEELEKLEQSITLTLQEIDHNFSKAHRIVTTSIIPVVGKYAEHSKEVWEGSKFWKQFFEASANVSLSGYEEPAEGETATEDTTEDTTETTASSSVYGSPSQSQDNIEDLIKTPSQPRNHDDTTISSTSFDGEITPRAQATSRNLPTIAPYNSPYEKLKRQIQGKGPEADTDESLSSGMPSTPLFHRESPDDQQSSPFLPLSTARQISDRSPAKDPLLHRILDKNWRLQATPHSQARGVGTFPYRVKATETLRPSPRKRDHTHTRMRDLDDLDSSPPAPAPTLHAEIFDSPLRRPRVPGVSIFTPARKQGETAAEGAKAHDDVFTGKGQGGGEEEDRQTGRRGVVRNIANIWDSDSDDEGLEGMSPPKTMQFHVPQTRLLRTPAREASKRIVEDLLLTAGGNITDELDEESPSVVKRGGGLLEDDTF